MKPVLCVEGLVVRRNGRAVLEGADLRVERDGILALVGPNGAGKSTLLRVLTGQLEPHAGRVEVLGRSPRRARGRVGLLPQSPGFDPDYPVRVRDVVAMGRLRRSRWWGYHARADRAAVERALARTDAQSLADLPVGRLSGGQRQRVLIARALVDDPELLLLDEPTASLDPGSAERIYDVLERVAERRAVVLVTHDLTAVTRLATQVALVDRRVVGISDRLERSWLGVLLGTDPAGLLMPGESR
jgi:zinc transport system ATP-binding protein